MKKALLFGATGFIGSYLLTDLLNAAEYEQVTIVVRKNPDIAHPKLKVLIGDLKSLESLKKDLMADDVFLAIGTTKNKIPDEQEYYKIDHDYPVLAAKLAKENGAKSVFVVTAVGANSRSRFFYVRTKGEIERDLLSLGFEHTHIFRPSMLLGNRNEHRALEKTLISTWSFVDRILMGNFSSYKGIDGKDVAKAMLAASRSQTEKIQIYQWNEMHALARS